MGTSSLETDHGTGGPGPTGTGSGPATEKCRNETPKCVSQLEPPPASRVTAARPAGPGLCDQAQLAIWELPNRRATKLPPCPRQGGLLDEG